MYILIHVFTVQGTLGTVIDGGALLSQVHRDTAGTLWESHPHPEMGALTGLNTPSPRQEQMMKYAVR